MTEPILDLKSVSLCYRLAKQRHTSFKEYLIHWVKGALTYEPLWALRDVTFKVQPGEVVGIMGRNGAGKSTLLKVIAGVLKPTKGENTVNGSVIPLLELGMGFDLELTGIENIYLNALFLGHTRQEIDDHLDSIIQFSGLRDFINSPIRNYSSGMFARLGFSIATAWKPEILILDEVLAVGDMAFKKKCADKLREFREGGTTILTVSHTPADILSSCSRAIFLHQGQLLADGDPQDVVEAYEERVGDRSRLRATKIESVPGEDPRFVSATGVLGTKD